VTSLVRSEFRRVASRRFLQVLSLVFLGVLAFVNVIVFIQTAKHHLTFSTGAPRAMHIASDILFTWAVVAGATTAHVKRMSDAMCIARGAPVENVRWCFAV